MNKVAISLDFELNVYYGFTEVIEVGLTEIHLSQHELGKTVSFPVKHCYPIVPEISELTGWTNTKLDKSGYLFTDIVEKLKNNFGVQNRLIIIDQANELIPFERQCLVYNTISPFGFNRMNVTDLYKIKKNDFTSQSLDGMIQGVGLEFEGRQHRAGNDSRNIARLFLELIK